MLNQSNFSGKTKLLKQANIIHFIFLLVFNVSTLQADTRANPLISQQPSNYSSSSGMVKVGLNDIPEKENFSLEYFIKEKAYLKLLEKDVLPYLKRKSRKTPTCFISYAWGDRYHEYWVKRFCEMLNKAGIQVLLDRWVVKKGNVLNEFVRKIEEVDWVIVVGTKLYLEKYNKQAANAKEKEHVARLEGQLIEYLVRYSTERSNKVVPILLEGTPEESLPFMLRHKISSEFTKNDYFEELLKLIHDLYNIDNRDKHFEEIIEKFRKYATAAGEHITGAERKAYEKKRKDGIIALDKEIKEEIDLYKDEAFKLAEELAERDDYIEKELNLPTSSVYFSLHSYIPQAKLNGYVPRAKEQQELRQKLKKTGVCVVYGHGGVGKSTLVAQYGHEQNEKYQQTVWWMEAETSEKLIANYGKLAEGLDIHYRTLAKSIKEPARYLEELSRKVYNILADNKQSLLIILDNVKDAKLIGGCLLHRPSLIQAIITTRDKKSFKDYNQVELNSFTQEEGKTYIQQRLQELKPSEQDIEALIKEVGLIPQKLALATGYITEISFMNIKKYVAKLRTDKQQGKKRAEGFVLPEVSLGLERLDGLSQLVMRYGAYLDPDFIPLSLVSALLKASDEEKLGAIFARLEKLSLITINNSDASKQGIQIHREVQAACKEYQKWRGRAKQSNPTLMLSLLKVLNNHMPMVGEVPDSTWDQARLYASNITSILTYAIREEMRNLELAELLDRIGKYNEHVVRNYKQALSGYEQALKIRRTLYTGNHPDIARSLNDMGLGYIGLSQYQEALKYLKQAFEIDQALYSGDHPHTAMVLYNIGLVYYRLGQYQKALKYYEQALQMRKALFADNHPDIAQSLNNIGTIYYRLGQNQEALKYYAKTLQMRKALFIDNHPDIATSLNNIGIIYSILGQYEEALKYSEQALQMRKALFIDNHPDIAQSLNNIGRIYSDLGQTQEALKYLEQSLAMMQAVYEGNHRAIAISLNNIGIVYSSLGQCEEALKYLEQALQMRKALFTDNHPDIANSLNSIGNVYYSLGQSQEALKHLEQALQMRKALFTDNHPDIAASLDNIGYVYQTLGQHQEALKYHHQALEIVQAMYSYNNPATAHCLNSLGVAYKDLCQYGKALKYSKQSLKMMRGLYIGNHPIIATSLNILGEVYQALGKYEVALEYYEQALKMRQDLYPDNPNHPDIQKVRRNIEKLEEEQQKAKES